MPPMPVDDAHDPHDNGIDPADHIDAEPLPTAEELDAERRQNMADPKGRKTLFCKERCEKIIKHLRDGIPREHAARLVGISPVTLANWLRYGRERVKHYREFFRRVQYAESHNIAKNVKILNSCAKGGHVKRETLIEKPDGTMIRTTDLTPPDYRAALAILERRDMENWSLIREEIRELKEIYREQKAKQKAENESNAS